MIYHIRRYKPLSNMGGYNQPNTEDYYHTTIEEGCRDFPDLNVKPIHDGRSPYIIVGYEVYINDVDTISALKRAYAMFKLAEERDSKEYWRDDLGRVLL